MSEIKVQDGMLKAAHEKAFVGMGTSITERILEAALRWLDIEIRFLLTDDKSEDYAKAIEDVRRIFIAEPEIPEEIEDLLWLKRMRISPSNLPDPMYARHDADVIEAYRLGRDSKDGKR